MWLPKTPHSNTEIQKTKEGDATLEGGSAESLLPVDQRKAGLSERSAYIVPIHTLSHDILSIIFVDLCEKNWKTPLQLQSVCRNWRAVLLDTPLAWTFIPLNKNRNGNSEIVCLFLERSCEVPLHLPLSQPTAGRISEKIIEMKRRVKCLNIGVWGVNTFRNLDESWSRLDKLHIYFGGTAVADRVVPSVYDISALIHLRVLHIYHADSLLSSIAASSKFPALKELIIHCTDPSPLENIMTKCAESIKYMELGYNGMAYKEPQPTTRITFAELKFLCLTNKHNDNNTNWLFNGEAPNLVGLFMRGITGTMLWPSNVIYLGTTELVSLSNFPKIRFLHVTLDRGSSEVELVRRYLRDASDYCLDLRVITQGAFYETLDRRGLEKIEESLNQTKPRDGLVLLRTSWTQMRLFCKARVPDVVDIHGPCSAFLEE